MKPNHMPKTLNDAQQYALDTLARGLYIISIKKDAPTITMQAAREMAAVKLFRTPWTDKQEQIWTQRQDQAMLREMGLPNGSIVRSGKIEMRAVGLMAKS